MLDIHISVSGGRLLRVTTVVTAGQISWFCDLPALRIGHAAINNEISTIIVLHYYCSNFLMILLMQS